MTRNRTPTAPPRATAYEITEVTMGAARVATSGMSGCGGVETSNAQISLGGIVGMREWKGLK